MAPCFVGGSVGRRTQLPVSARPGRRRLQRHVGLFPDKAQDALRKNIRAGPEQHARRFTRLALRIHLRGNDRHASGGAAAFYHRRVKK